MSASSSENGRTAFLSYGSSSRSARALSTQATCRSDSICTGMSLGSRQWIGRPANFRTKSRWRVNEDAVERADRFVVAAAQFEARKRPLGSFYLSGAEKP